MTEQTTSPTATGAAVTPFLMFEGEGGAAMDFYVQAFAPYLPAAVTRRDLRDASHPETADSPDLVGTVVHGEITLADQRLRVFDSPPGHPFTFTPSISLFVDLPASVSPEDLDRLAGALSEGGHPLMPPGDYGFSRRFAWVADRWGVTWQLNLA